VIEAEFFLHLLMRLLAHPARFDGGGQRPQVGIARQVGKSYFRSPDARCSPTSHTSSPGMC